MQLLLKVLISALIIAGVSELGKRFTPVAAVLASLPLTSILAFIWLYAETKSNQKVIDLSYGIFWMVIPSLTFFIALPWLLKKEINFYWALLIASAFTAVFYFGFIYLLDKWEINKF